MSMVENASDWAEVCQLKAAYGGHYEAPDFDALVDLFTDDAVCVFGAYGTWHGKEEIRAGFAENVGAGDTASPPLHTVATPRTATHGGEARGKWSLLDFGSTGAADEPVLRVMGV